MKRQEKIEFKNLNVYPETKDLIHAIAELEDRPIARVVNDMAIRYSQLGRFQEVSH